MRLQTIGRRSRPELSRWRIKQEGVIAVGGKTVSANASTPSGAFMLQGSSITLEINDLSKVWLDATVSGDLVTYTYIA